MREDNKKDIEYALKISQSSISIKEKIKILQQLADAYHQDAFYSSCAETGEVGILIQNIVNKLKNE